LHAQISSDSSKFQKDSNFVFQDSLRTKLFYLEEIEVISTKYEMKVRDVSIPIEVSDKEEIFNTSGSTTSDILKNEPGISLSRDGIWGTSISVRGLSKNNIVVLIDGNRIETATDIAASLSLIEVNDLNRIEVIKSAASSLYGSGALGGVVNIITESGFYPKIFQLSGTTISSFNSVNNNGSGTLAFNLGNTNWFIHLRGTLRSADDTETPRGILNNSQFRNSNYSIFSGYKFLGNQEIKISYQNYLAEDVGIPGNSLFPSNAEVRYLKAERKLSSFEYNIKNPFNSLAKIQTKIFYQEIDRDVENIPHQVSLSNNRTMRTSVLKITPNGNHKTTGASLQSNWILGKTNLLIAGFEAWQRELLTDREQERLIEVIDTNTQSVISSTHKIIGEKPIPDANYRSLGFFVQDELEIIEDRLKLTFGGRIDQIHIENDEVYNPLYEITNGSINYSPANKKIIWNEEEVEDISWSGTASLLYSLFEDVDLTCTAAHSFRSPSLEERYQYIDQAGLLKIGNPGLEPEKGYFFDAGLRIWKEDLNFTGNIFLNLLNNLVADEPGMFEGRAALIKTNIGKARLYGFDFGFKYNFLINYSISGILSYVNGDDTENNNYLSQIPPLNGRIVISADPINLFQIGVAANFFADQDKVAPGEIRTPGYVTYDLQLFPVPFNFGFNSLQISSGVDNITNKSYRNHLATNRGLITSEPGRNFFIKIRVEW